VTQRVTCKSFPGLLSFFPPRLPPRRFTGWTGACVGNAPTCRLFVQGDSSVSASFEYELQTLVPNDGHNFQALALNSTSVFFGRWTFDGNGVWRVPKTGGAATLVASGVPSFIVADDAFVYWTDNYSIYSAPVEGGSASLLASTGSIGRLALDGQGALYWAESNLYSGTGAVHRMQDRVDAVIASGQHETGGIAVDATYAYFTCGTWDGTDRAVRRVPKKGGSVETLVTPNSVPAYVRVDSANVYYQDWMGMWVWSKSGGAPRLLSPNSNAEFDVNDSVVWWLSFGSPPVTPNGLFRANADGTRFASVDTAFDYSWSGPRVDDTAVYYFHEGALLRRLK